MAQRTKKRWVARVNTESTFPPEGLFKKNAATIARTLASRKVSPKGPGSGMRMLSYFINRAGKGLMEARRKELEKAKELLHKRVERDRKTRQRKAA
jgi:tRNA(adenine34) deaminase